MNLIEKNVMNVLRDKLDHHPYLRENKHAIMHLVRQSEKDVFADKLYILKVKLKSALAEIRKQQNIYVRQGFSCCGSCGSYELSTLCKETGKEGYMFFSRQAKNDLNTNGSVFFNFYSMSEEHFSTITLGRNIVTKLKQHGINVEWNGTSETAIKVGI